jgi:hypothetical protein
MCFKCNALWTLGHSYKPQKLYLCEINNNNINNEDEASDLSTTDAESNYSDSESKNTDIESKDQNKDTIQHSLLPQ